jgi:hypothetical protein
VAVAHLGGAEAGIVRALGFVALIAADLALVLAVRGPIHVHEGNRGVRWMVPVVAGVIALTLLIPFLRELFGFAAVGWASLAAATLAGAVPVLVLGQSSWWFSGRRRPSSAHGAP